MSLSATKKHTNHGCPMPFSQSGIPLSTLQEMGGWESIEMVRRYAHLSPNHLTEHARKIDEVMGINVTNLALLKKVADN
ncbi:TPA: tyrosine-type recombinase/integrase [Yersinia enterocolitica]